MGQKVNPTAFRLGILERWKSRWFGRGSFSRFLEEDHIVRGYIENKLPNAAIERVEIVRSGNAITVNIKTARPGLIIGRGGKGLEVLQKGIIAELRKIAKRRKDQFTRTVKIEIEELRRPESYSRLVAKNIAEQLERRMPFRRVMRQTIDKVTQQKEVIGVRVSLAGRLGGAEIARTEQLSRGKVPLQTLRANIDYAQETARTTYGAIGIKVWIYKGEVFEEDKKN